MLPDLQSCRACHGGERTSLPVPSTCAMCHDYHMDQGVPAELLRQRARGQRLANRRSPAATAAAGRGRPRAED